MPFTATLRSRAALAAILTTVTVALIATALAYPAFARNTLTLSLDGEAREVSTDADTVGEVLEDEGIEVGAHDVVAPELDAAVDDGTRIAVRFGRPLDINLDGKESRHWVTATDVTTALDQIGLRVEGANLSTSRGAEIDRSGMALTIATPKKVTFAIAGKKPQADKVAALTVRQALKMHHVKVDKDDEVRPRMGKVLDGGEKITVTKVHVVKKAVKNEAIPFATQTTSDASMYEGEEEVARDGRAGHRDVTYRLRFENGKVVARKVLQVRDVVSPVSRLVKVGTKERVEAPAVTSSNFASGSTVWDALAGCESGGNWAMGVAASTRSPSTRPSSPIAGASVSHGMQA
ncbi:MAG TPA: G5 domain-containing protein, partial [Marmoricola sp.]|nr:G5 domain-containing protein [Marmoricola sp.]